MSHCRTSVVTGSGSLVDMDASFLPVSSVFIDILRSKFPSSGRARCWGHSSISWERRQGI